MLSTFFFEWRETTKRQAGEMGAHEIRVMQVVVIKKKLSPKKSPQSTFSFCTLFSTENVARKNRMRLWTLLVFFITVFPIKKMHRRTQKKIRAHTRPRRTFREQKKTWSGNVYYSTLVLLRNGPVSRVCLLKRKIRKKNCFFSGDIIILSMHPCLSDSAHNIGFWL